VVILAATAFAASELRISAQKVQNSSPLILETASSLRVKLRRRRATSTSNWSPANYYHRKHALKSTLDVAWAPDGVRQGESSLGTVDSPTNEGQITVRAQLQLVF